VSVTDYIVNSILVLLVVRQIYGTRLTLQTLVLPVALVAVAVAYYHPSVPTAGNDVALYVTLGGTGVVLGTLCALATHMRRGPDGVAVAKAGWLAAAAWVAGIGARMAFAISATHGGEPAIARFSATHHITSGDAWVAALFAMALAEVTARLVVLRLRSTRLPAVQAPAPAHAPANV
jgi:hypothetical protein